MKNMRAEMPGTATFIDKLRVSFGKEVIDVVIKDGINGKPVFYASENGYEIGTRVSDARSLIRWDSQGRSYAVDIPAGLSVDQELDLIRQAKSVANKRIFDRKGQEIQGVGHE